MSDKYILNDDHSVTPCDDLLEWARWFEKAERIVKVSAAKAASPDGAVRVSTVFLGLDHSFGNGPPQLFETMIFGGPRDGDCERYATWNEAIAGHERMAKAIEAAT